MTNLQPYEQSYAQLLYKWVIHEEILPESVKKSQPNKIVWRNPEEKQSEEDLLSFMESFDFPDLAQLKISLKNSGLYTQEQINEIISGLATLPEYRG